LYLVQLRNKKGVFYPANYMNFLNIFCVSEPEQVQYAFITLSPTVSGLGRFSVDFVRIFSNKSAFYASNNSSTGVKPVESATVVFNHFSILAGSSAIFCDFGYNKFYIIWKFHAFISHWVQLADAELV
jgi:hypothetical protein